MHELPAAGQAPAHPDVSYEKTDVRFAPIAFAGGGLVVLILIGYVVALGAFDALKAKAARKAPGLSPLAAKERTKLPADIKKIPEPRLQVFEAGDMDELRRQEDKLLNGYGWTDAKNGTVHIPIREAMRLLAEKHKTTSKGGG
jgi:hypothetical protein